MIRKGPVAFVLAALLTCCAALANDAGTGLAATPSVASAKSPRPQCRIYFGCVPTARHI